MDFQEHSNAVDERKVPIANLYHLLCYAWEFFELDDQVLVDKDDHKGYAQLITKVFV